MKSMLNAAPVALQALGAVAVGAGVFLLLGLAWTLVVAGVLTVGLGAGVESGRI